MRRYWRCVFTVIFLISLLGISFYLHPLKLLITKQYMSLVVEEAERLNGERLGRVKRVCTENNLGLYQHKSGGAPAQQIKYPPAPQYSVFYFTNKQDSKVAYCPLYKAASTTWLYNLCLLGGYTEVQLDTSKEQLSTLARRIYPEIDYPQAEQVLNESFRLLTVRHPFDRLVSAYRDKLENVNINREHGTEHFYRKYGQKIVAKYRHGGNETNARSLLVEGTYMWEQDRPQPSGLEPTFKEFVRYLIETDLNSYADDHWIPYYLYCTPCWVKYDLIAKIETLHKDQALFIDKLGLVGRLTPRWQHRTGTALTSSMFSRSPPSSDSVARMYFSQLSLSEAQDLYEKYRLDFEMFDYSPREYYDVAKNLFKALY